MIDYQAQDAQVCTESHCRKCFHKGLEYYTFRDWDGYRVWMSKCPECGKTEEF